MKATILLEIDTESDTDLLAICDEIRDAVDSHGIEVSSVKPWKRPSLLLPTLPEQLTPPPQT